MARMTTLSETHTLKRPVQHRITRLDTPESVHHYGRTYDNYPGPDGTFELPSHGYVHRFSQPEDTYLVEVLDKEGHLTGEFNLLNGEEFQECLQPYEAPYFEYGIQVISRPRDVVSHGGSIEYACDALKALPVLIGSGDYGIVRRSVTEPGPWERVE